MNIEHAINQRFRCHQCGADASWRREQRSEIRVESAIHWLRCTHCGARIVAKVSRDNGPADATAKHLHDEYSLLRELQTLATRDAYHGFLEPLDYFAWNGHGIMLTRRFEGIDLAHYLRTAERRDACASCHAAGAWLRRLHEAGGRFGNCTVGTGEKLDDLFKTYGPVLPNSQVVSAAQRLLGDEAEPTEQVMDDAVRIHGDFKPQNLLISQTQMVGLDIHWQSTGQRVYDLAPFLNHLWLLARPWTVARIRQNREAAAIAFLDGYGNTPDRRVLLWVRLYFALCHLGSYYLRGGASIIAARTLIQPLIDHLMREKDALG